jgi:hypothetical protein
MFKIIQTRQDKTRQDKTRQDKTRQDNMMEADGVKPFGPIAAVAAGISYSIHPGSQ